MEKNRNKHMIIPTFIYAAAALAALLMLLLPCETVLADKTVNTDRSGSVTIRYFDDVDARTPVNGAQFTFYKIDDSQDTTTYTDTTNQDGILRITDMKLGRYRVVETSPAPGHKASTSFLLTIPMTENNEWIYDITLEPKASLELQTTTKSVYTGTGSTSNSIYTAGGNSSTASTGTRSSSDKSTTAGSTSSVVKSRPARTGDDSQPTLWLIYLFLAALLMKLSIHRGSHLTSE